jgi:hypothetical protein
MGPCSVPIMNFVGFSNKTTLKEELRKVPKTADMTYQGTIVFEHHRTVSLLYIALLFRVQYKGFQRIVKFSRIPPQDFAISAGREEFSARL